MRKRLRRSLLLLLACCLVLPVCAGLAPRADATPGSGFFVDFSDPLQGKFTVRVSLSPVEELDGVILRFRYAKEVFAVTSAKAAVTQKEGESVALFPGLWAFGEREDGNGYSAAFVSAGGVTRTSTSAFCEVDFRILDPGETSPCVAVEVLEKTTADGNDENDIYSCVTVGEKVFSLTDEERFGWRTLSDGTVLLTDYCFFEKDIAVPDAIAGKTVSGIGDECFRQVKNAWISLPDTVCSLSSSAFPKDEGVVLFCKEGSETARFAAANADAWAVYGSDAQWDAKNRCLCIPGSAPGALREVLAVSGEAVEAVTQKASLADGTDCAVFGTGSTLGIAAGGTVREMTLCVRGDANADGVCDAFDVSACEQAMTHIGYFAKPSSIALCYYGGTEPCVLDYLAIVNDSLKMRKGA